MGKLPDTHLWPSQVARQIGSNGSFVKRLLEEGRLQREEVVDDEGNTVSAVNRAVLEQFIGNIPDGWERPEWRDTYVSVDGAASRLGVSKELMRGLVGSAGLQLEEVSVGQGRTRKMLRRDAVDRVQQKMAALKQ